MGGRAHSTPSVTTTKMGVTGRGNLVLFRFFVRFSRFPDYLDWDTFWPEAGKLIFLIENLVYLLNTSPERPWEALWAPRGGPPGGPREP